MFVRDGFSLCNLIYIISVPQDILMNEALCASEKCCMLLLKMVISLSL